MHPSVKRKLIVTATAAAAVAFAGGAYAASTDSTNPRQAFLNDAAKRLNVSPGALSSALDGAFHDQLQAAVKAGRLTQAQANEIKQRVQHGGGAPPLGFFGPHLEGGRPGDRLSAAASYLGLTEAQLETDLAQGKTLAQIASSKGKSVSGLKSAMYAAAKAKLDKLVSSRIMTSAQETQFLSLLSSRLSDEINGKLPGPGFRGRFRPDFGGRGGADGPPAGWPEPPGAPPAGVPGAPPPGSPPPGPPGPGPAY